VKRFFNKLFKFLAYAAAALVISLAIAVGLFRLFLPRLPEYQDQIKDWASDAIGMQVQFSGMDARWGLRGPELEFYDAELIRRSNSTRVVAAEEVSVGVALMRLLADRKLVVDRVSVRDTAIEVRQLEDGRLWVQGTPVDDLLNAHTAGAGGMGNIEVVGEDIELRFLQPGDERPRFFDVPRIQFQRDDEKLTIQAVARLPDALGRDVSVSAIQLLPGLESQRSWDVSVELEGINLAEATEMLGENARGFSSGVGDLDVSLVVAGQSVRSATADIDLQDVSIGSSSEFEVSGRLEYSRNDTGWLVAADEFTMTTPDGRWPDTSLRLETSVNEEGEIVMLDARASYLNIVDVGIFLPWFPDAERARFREFAPDGRLRDLAATVSDVHRIKPKFDLNVVLESVGVAAVDKWPGVRGFSGALRASSAGGRLEIESGDVTVVSEALFPDPLPIDVAEGTLIWRVGNNRTTFLSDSIRIRNEFISSENNVQLTIVDGVPNIDFVSTFAVTDIATAKRYIPRNFVKPRLYNWFQQALQSGNIPAGSARLYGPLNKFPFDDGEGQLFVQSNVKNAQFKYHPDWPVTDLIDVDVIVDNVRLYTERGRSAATGNQVTDAKVEIANLREPVLTIKAFATGTLETVRQFVMQSPLDKLLGGQLARVSVEGDAAFDLDLNIPIKSASEFDVTTSIQTSNGRVQVEGFPAGVMDLSGVVIVTRDDIRSETLGGTFLGQPVNIELRSATADEPRFTAIARATGVVTSQALADDLGLPVATIVDGSSDYELFVRFPRGGAETPTPMTFEINSDLVGMAIGLPPPFGKAANDEWPTSGDIRLSGGGTRIDSTGIAGQDVSWQLGVVNGEEGWDLDRGVLALGGELIEPAETRGLHIRGNTDTVRLDDWLALSRSGTAQLGTADRVRSIDLAVTNMFVLGQHLVDHRVTIDRSARDWLVQFEGDSVTGSVFVPYDFGGDRALVLDMERLHLPGDDVSPQTDDDMPDPRTLPPITLRAADFALGKRNFGALETELRRTADGLETDSIIATDETFEFVGNGRWVVDETDPAGQRTFVTATLTSSDVQATMNRLDYDPGIISDDMSVLLDLSWSGGPRADFLDSLDGQVQARFGAGQLEEVEPGAGRMFGLMSVVALPRRLSLDFSDVFDRGFGFDNINGTFRIEDGNAFTCNLSLEGPAADIGIVGRTGLAGRDYAQTAVVSANFGNTLPVVAGFAAGPQAAAAVFLFSQIFKKPLQEVGQVYYSIDGSWDDPSIDSSDTEGFAGSGELAGCLADTG